MFSYVTFSTKKINQIQIDFSIDRKDNFQTAPTDGARIAAITWLLHLASKDGGGKWQEA